MQRRHRQLERQLRKLVAEEKKAGAKRPKRKRRKR
jgi:hypothetical protein